MAWWTTDQIHEAGWGVVEGSRILREYPITLGRIEGHGRRGKALTADYVLVYCNHKLAVIEAKAWDKPLKMLTCSTAQTEVGFATIVFVNVGLSNRKSERARRPRGRSRS